MLSTHRSLLSWSSQLFQKQNHLWTRVPQIPAAGLEDSKQNTNRTQDPLPGGNCWKSFPPSRENPKSTNSKEKKSRKMSPVLQSNRLALHRTWHRSAFLNSFFFLDKRDFFSKSRPRIQPNENCFVHSHTISDRSKKKKIQLLLIYLLQVVNLFKEKKKIKPSIGCPVSWHRKYIFNYLIAY